MNRTAKEILIIVAVLLGIIFIGSSLTRDADTKSVKDTEVKYSREDYYPLYMDGCDQLSNTTNYCNCTYNYLEDNSTEKELLELFVEYAGSNPPDWAKSKLESAVNACLSEIN